MKNRKTYADSDMKEEIQPTVTEQAALPADALEKTCEPVEVVKPISTEVPSIDRTMIVIGKNYIVMYCGGHSH
jgi:hypothetical protein